MTANSGPVGKLLSKAGRAKPPPRWVGLDLGGHSIKLVELERSPGGWRLIKSLIQDLPRGASGDAVDRSGWLQSVLKEAPAEGVHAALGGPDVAIRRLSMPLMSKRELAEAVKWQVKDQIPFPVHDALLDFRVVGEVWEKDIKKQDVVVAAAAPAVGEGLVSAVERAAGRVASLSPSACAAWRCVSALVPETTQGSTAVIELGASGTTVTIAKDGHLRLVRHLPVGSDSVTDALVGVVPCEQGEVAIDASKAEALKRRCGVLLGEVEGTTEEGVPLFHLSSLMRSVLEQLLTEISRVFDFYKVQMDEVGIARVFLCGGGANLKQLPRFLAEGLGMTVEVFNPLIRLPERTHAMEPEQVAEGVRLTGAIGAAMEHGDGLNLLPGGRQQRAAVPRLQRWRRLLKGVAVAALAGYAGLLVAAGLVEWQWRRAARQWAELEPAYHRGMATASAAAAFEGAATQAQRFLDQQPLWGGLFKDIGAVIPATVELTELTVSSDARMSSGALRVSLKGKATAVGTAGQGSIAAFMEALEHSVFFRDVKLVNSHMLAEETGQTEFELEGALE